MRSNARGFVSVCCAKNRRRYEELSAVVVSAPPGPKETAGKVAAVRSVAATAAPGAAAAARAPSQAAVASTTAPEPESLASDDGTGSAVGAKRGADAKTAVAAKRGAGGASLVAQTPIEARADAAGLAKTPAKKRGVDVGATPSRKRGVDEAVSAAAAPAASAVAHVSGGKRGADAVGAASLAASGKNAINPGSSGGGVQTVVPRHTFWSCCCAGGPDTAIVIPVESPGTMERRIKEAEAKKHAEILAIVRAVEGKAPVSTPIAKKELPPVVLHRKPSKRAARLGDTK